MLKHTLETATGKMSTKVKYAMTRNEAEALMRLMGTIEAWGNYNGLEGKASMAILKKVYLRLLNRWETFSHKKHNTITLSWPEVWALKYQIKVVYELLDDYLKNLILRFDMEVHPKMIN